LAPLLTTTVAATGTQSLPADYLDVLFIFNGTVGSTQIRIRNLSSSYPFLAGNTYLASSTTQPYCYISGTQVIFETSVQWTMTYFKMPTDTSGTVDPALSAIAHNAMVQYAFAFLLEKDHDERASDEFNKFFQLLKDLYY
jgi:hypothetical protein